MSEPATPARPFYVTGGTLKPGEPSYVERRADTDLFDSILAGEFCYVLTARQMGKSSLMARTATRLEQVGVASAIVDLTQIGSERGAQGAAAQWYFGIANEIHRRLKITEPLRPWWQERSDLPPAQRLTGFFRELVLTYCPGRVVIFVDEIDSTIGLPFADDFFAALRACFNARATEPEFERLTFVLLGVATPDQLIQDPTRTPFNIGKRIDLSDFSPAEARTLAPGLHVDPDEADRRLERILYWTGGHPYLSQALCRAVREKAADAGVAEMIVDPQVGELFLSSRAQREETNLKHARARLEKTGPEGRRLLQLYRRVRQGKPVPDQPTSPLFAQLKLAGVVKVTDEGRLAVRNRVYEAVFTREWVKSAMPTDHGRQLVVATLAASLAGVLVVYVAFQPFFYERAFRAAVEDDGYNSALGVYKALHANPFYRSRATELMQQFWEQRALRYALAGKRDESLLSCLQGLRLKNSESLRRRIRNLVGLDYERIRFTLRTEDVVTAAAFGPDGRNLAMGFGDGTTRLWDDSTGKRLDFLLQPLPREKRVGETLVKGPMNDLDRIFEAITGSPNAASLRHKSSVFSLAFSPNGRILVTGSGDGTARLWDAVTGKSLAPPLQHESSVFAVSLGLDGRTLATGTYAGTYLWDAVTGSLLSPSLKHESSVAVAFSRDGRSLARASKDGTVRLLDAFSGKLLSRPLPHEKAFAVAFSPDGRILATGSLNGTVRLWDVFSGKPLASLFRHESPVFTVVFSPDGRTVATGTLDGAVRFWDVFTGKSLAPTLQHEEMTSAMAFSRDGRTLAAGYFDGTLRLWNAITGVPLDAPLQQQTTISAITLSRDGRTLATGSWGGIARLWDAVTGQPLTLPWQHEKTVSVVAFSLDGRTLVTVSRDGTARLWDAVTGQPLAPPLQHEKSVSAVAFSYNGRILATGSTDGTARLWDVVTGRPLTPPLKHEDAVVVLAFSPNGHALATASADGTARLWDAVTGKLLTRLFNSGKIGVTTAAFSPDSRILAAGCSDKTVRLWEVATGKPIAFPPEMQESARTLAFNPNGKAFFVATDRWLNTYSWDGKKAVPQGSQLLHGSWKGGFRFPTDCERCLQVALGDAGNSFHLETLHLDEPVDPPIEGDPKKLLEKWQGRLGLKFDDEMRPVPAVDLSGAPAEALGDGRRSPGVRQR